MPQSDVLNLAARFTAAIEAQDMTAMGTMLADDFVLWHNATGRELRDGAGKRFLQEYFPQLRSVRYRDIRVSATSSGWVQQHLVDLEFADGNRLTGLAACVVVVAADGVISRIDEYFDASRTAIPSELQ
jgi:ketosteroid isomerase-like protein